MDTLEQQIEQKKKEISDGVYSDISIVKLQKELSDLYEALNIEKGYKVGDYCYGQYGELLVINKFLGDNLYEVTQYFEDDDNIITTLDLYYSTQKITKETFGEIIGNWKNFKKVIKSLEDQIKSLRNNISQMHIARDEQTRQILLKMEKQNDTND